MAKQSQLRTRKGAKSKAAQDMSLCKALDVTGKRAAFALANVESGQVSVMESAGWYWVERSGQYTSNERYETPAQVLRAVGLSDSDRNVWTVREM